MKWLQFFTITNHAVMNSLVLLLFVCPLSNPCDSRIWKQTVYFRGVPGTIKEKTGKGKQKRRMGKKAFLNKLNNTVNNLDALSLGIVYNVSKLFYQITRRLKHLSIASPTLMLRIARSYVNIGTSWLPLCPSFRYHLLLEKGLNQRRGTQAHEVEVWQQTSSRSSRRTQIGQSDMGQASTASTKSLHTRDSISELWT